MTTLDLLSAINECRLTQGKSKIRNNELIRKARAMVGGRDLHVFNNPLGTDMKYYEITQDEWDKLYELHSVAFNAAHGAYEHGALCAIEQLLGVKLVKQFNVDGYRIDGYCIETNTAYEIDEPQHFIGGELRQECKDRQAYIENKLGCTTVRIKV